MIPAGAVQGKNIRSAMECRDSYYQSQGMSAKNIYLQHGKKDTLVSIVANVDEVKRKKCIPGNYGGGGKLKLSDVDIPNPTRITGDALDFKDAREKLLVREVNEEAHIEIEPKLTYITTSIAFLRPNENPYYS